VTDGADRDEYRGRPRPQEEVFEYATDASRFPEWGPGSASCWSPRSRPMSGTPTVRPDAIQQTAPHQVLALRGPHTASGSAGVVLPMGENGGLAAEGEGFETSVRLPAQRF
jgi:hypothetical protein